MKADEWAGVVRDVAAKRGVTYEPMGGLNPKDGPVALCVGRDEPDHRRARERVLGLVVRRRRARDGGLFSKTVLPQAILAKAHMPDLAQVVPMFNVESIEPGEKIEQLASRRKVEFESIDFNKRYLATVPADHDPVALRELFSPGFLDWAAQIRNEVEFGITDRQLYFTWKLTELTAAEYGDALDHAAGLFKRLRNEMEESGLHTYLPGPWHAGLAPFPDS